MANFFQDDEDAKKREIAKFLGLTPPAAPVVAAAPAAAPVAQDDGGDWKNSLALALSGLGDSYSAGTSRPTNSVESTLGVIEGKKEKAKKDVAYQREQANIKEMDDPASETSKQYQTLAASFTGKKPEEFATMSATKIGTVLPVLKEKYASEETNYKKKEDAKRQVEMDDPASGISKEYQSRYKEIFGKPTNAPATVIKDFLASQKMDVTMGEKKDQLRQKRFAQMSDAIDPTKQTRGAFAISKQVYDRAERLESLASAFPDGNLDSRQIEELAIGLNAMLSGANVGAQKQVEGLVPKTVVGNTEKMAEFLTNNPRGLQQQEFVKRMLGSIAREKKTAEDQINRTQFQRLSPFIDLEKEDPDTFNHVMQSHNISPDAYTDWKKGGYKPISAVQGAEDGVGAVLTATNKKTGEKLKSTDGGKTWLPMQ